MKHFVFRISSRYLDTVGTLSVGTCLGNDEFVEAEEVLLLRDRSGIMFALQLGRRLQLQTDEILQRYPYLCRKVR
jgi:hypothetical protein